MNELELINQPIELALAGRKFHFKKLPVLKRHAMAQAWYLSQLVSEAQDKARAAYANDEGMRRAYIAAAMDKMPAGQDLQDKLIELRLPPALAMQYIKTAMDEEMTMEELDRTILDASIEEYESVLRYVLNEKKNLCGQAVTGTSCIRSFWNARKGTISANLRR